MYSVAGRNTAMAIEIDRPGIAPKTRPMTMPGGTTSQAMMSPPRSCSAPVNAERSSIATPFHHRIDSGSLTISRP